MRFHILTKQETSNGSRHVDFDCKLGRVHQGLDRLAEWQGHFPDDPNLLHREAFLRSEYLGQGRRACALYQRAYEVHPGTVRGGLRITFSRSMAASDAAMFAGNFEEYQLWARRATGTARAKGADELARAVTQGQSFSFIQQTLASAQATDGHLGDAASLLEIALSGGELPLNEEIKLRRLRAQLLRKIDAQAEAARNARLESFPGAERLSLIEALGEIQRALSLDEFDAEMWNLQSAWLILLDRFTEGLECAEKAASLRPGAYSKPLINKAQALRALGRLEEAEMCARKSIEAAKASGDVQDAAMAKDLIESLHTAQSSPPDTSVDEWNKGFILGSLKAGEDEAAGVFMNVKVMTGGYLRRNAQAGGGWNMSQVQGVAELLTDHSSELCFAVVSNIAHLEPERFANILLAVHYIAAHGEGLVRKDAFRLLALLVLSGQSLPASRLSFRAGILIPAEAARDMNLYGAQPPFGAAAIAKLDASLLEELARIQPWLPNVLTTGQAAATELEKRNSLGSVLFKPLEGNPVARALWTPRGCLRKIGCVSISFIALFLFASGCVKCLHWMLDSVKATIAASAGTNRWALLLLGFLLCIGVFCVVFFTSYIRLGRRRYLCAGCSRLARKLSGLGSRGGVAISMAALTSGVEGVGRECPRCGRLYCSNCEGATLHCVCGHHPLPMVRLSYRQ